MKKRILLFTAVAGMATAMLTSGRLGAGAESGYNATGSETGLGNINGCKAGGCHGTTPTTGITVALELDSAGVATTHYKGGMTYTVKISGVNTTTNTLPRFGFQVSCIQGSTAVTTPVNAGTFASTGLPASVRYTAANATYYVCNMIEHSAAIVATSGTGGSGTTYVESFSWTAPAAGTGTISFWGALNAVNYDNTVGGDFWNTTSKVINEWATTSVANVSNDISIKAYPNPATSNLNIQLDNAQEGAYSLQVFDLNGRIVTNENITVTGTSHTTNINTGSWASGLYNVVLQKDGFSKTIPVVKR
ncbi:MAG: T9SS type A sorting domain-containing protein [Chitinophagales bacterium]